MCSMSIDEAVDRLLVLSNMMCTSASNLINEWTHKEKAKKRGMNSWRILGTISSYHAGVCCTVLNIIHEKLRNCALANSETFDDYFATSFNNLCRLEEKMRQSEVLTLELKCDLLNVHAQVLRLVLYCINKLK